MIFLKLWIKKFVTNFFIVVVPSFSKGFFNIFHLIPFSSLLLFSPQKLSIHRPLITTSIRLLTATNNKHYNNDHFEWKQNWWPHARATHAWPNENAVTTNCTRIQHIQTYTSCHIMAKSRANVFSFTVCIFKFSVCLLFVYVSVWCSISFIHHCGVSASVFVSLVSPSTIPFNSPALEVNLFAQHKIDWIRVGMSIMEKKKNNITQELTVVLFHCPCPRPFYAQIFVFPQLHYWLLRQYNIFFIAIRYVTVGPTSQPANPQRRHKRINNNNPGEILFTYCHSPMFGPMWLTRNSIKNNIKRMFIWL